MCVTGGPMPILRQRLIVRGVRVTLSASCSSLIYSARTESMRGDGDALSSSDKKTSHVWEVHRVLLRALLGYDITRLRRCPNSIEGNALWRFTGESLSPRLHRC